MNKRYVTSVASWVLGALAVRVNVAGFNPIGMGVFSAIMASGLVKLPAFIIMGVSVFMFWGFLTGAKYIMVMAAIGAVMAMARDKRERINEVIGALAGALLYGAMEITDILMSEAVNPDYAGLSLVILLTFSVSIVTSRIIEAIMISGKRLNGGGSKNLHKGMENIYEEKIKMIASSFERMSKSIKNMSDKSAVNCISMPALSMGNTDGMDTDDIPKSPQLELVNDIWRGRMMESRDAIALQLSEMSKILKDCTTSSYVFVNMGEQRERYLRLKLKNMGMVLKKIVVLNNRRGINEVNITIKAARGKYVTSRQLETAISDCFGKKYKMSRDMGNIIKKEYCTYNLIEAPNYFVLHGTAKCGRNGESISGDNFTCLELMSGQTLLSVSDGMGHGLKAYRESEMVLTLLEELMEGGFTEEASLRLINSVFIVDSDDISPASLDMGIIDLYSGVCDFMKIGASTTFVKRGGWIEAIKANSMPIGTENIVDMETASKKLYDGDFVIMVSDGVIDAIDMEDKDRYMSDILMDIHSTNPQEMAKNILDRIIEEADGRKNDDMLVMVAGVWDKCA
ncbi:MAG: SpoIIE family protein phosphatase [Lachnospiraceae bacterium]